MKVKGIIVGAGNRGKNYSRYAKIDSSDFEIVAVCEPRQRARNWMKEQYKLDDSTCFEDWRSLLEIEKIADCAIICTQDQDHVDPVVALASLGYHILVEKPMAVTPDDCRKIYDICKEKNVILAVCHILRYHPSVIKLKELIDSGIIGDVVNINHVEPVGFWHFAHSFVRGNWGNTARSTFSLLSKCCHDVDLISYWMSGQKCIKVSSFGSLQHFKKENKPSGAESGRCLTCKVEQSCPYSAKQIYLDHTRLAPSFHTSAVCDIEDSPEGYFHHLSKAIETGPYGKCVYETDNDVCDNQVVNFQFENGATASLTMIAFSEKICERLTSIYGTKGELRWDDFNNYIIRHYDFLTKSSMQIPCSVEHPGGKWGHGGSDYFTIQSFVQAISSNDPNKISTGPKVSLNSHLLTFAAEEARKTDKIIKFSEDPKWIVQD